MSDERPTKPYDFRDGLADRNPELSRVLQAIELPEQTPEPETHKSTSRNQLNLATELYVARQQLKLTQTQLGQKVGMSQTAIARIESGNGNPTLETLHKLAQAMELALTVRPISVKLEKT